MNLETAMILQKPIRVNKGFPDGVCLYSTGFSGSVYVKIGDVLCNVSYDTEGVRIKLPVNDDLILIHPLSRDSIDLLAASRFLAERELIPPFQQLDRVAYMPGEVMVVVEDYAERVTAKLNQNPMYSFHPMNATFLPYGALNLQFSWKAWKISLGEIPICHFNLREQLYIYPTATFIMLSEAVRVMRKFVHE